MYHCDCARPRTSTSSYIFLHAPSVKVLCRVRHSVTQFAANLSLDNDSWTVQECGCEARQTHCVPRVSSPRALRRQTVRHQPEHALTGSIFITTPAGPRPDWIHTSRTASRLDPCTTPAGPRPDWIHIHYHTSWTASRLDPYSLQHQPDCVQAGSMMHDDNRYAY